MTDVDVYDPTRSGTYVRRRRRERARRRPRSAAFARWAHLECEAIRQSVRAKHDRRAKAS